MFDIHQRIVDDHGDRDEKRCQAYVKGLLDAFAESPEGRALPETAGPVKGTSRRVTLAGGSVSEMPLSPSRVSWKIPERQPRTTITPGIGRQRQSGDLSIDPPSRVQSRS